MLTRVHMSNSVNQTNHMIAVVLSHFIRSVRVIEVGKRGVLALLTETH